MEYISKNYNITILNLQKNTYFLGKYLIENTKFFIGVDDIKENRYESFENDLTTNVEESILRISKNCKIELIQKEDERNLTTVFEYPVSSNNTYPINRTSFPYYNSMLLFKDSFNYPFEFIGNDGASITFIDSTELTNFIQSALTKHQEIYSNRYLSAINSVNEVTITTTLENAINNVFSIIY